jgi:O-antigen/teichoic acid export membrane protein
VSSTRGSEPHQSPTDLAQATTGASVLGGGTWLLASGFLPKLSNLVLSVALARLLGPDDFGRQAFIGFVSLSATTFLSSGASISLARHTAELLGAGATGRVRPLVRLAAAIGALAALGAGLALVIAAALGADPAAAWQLAGLATALAILQTVPNAVLLGTHRFREAAVISISTNLAMAPTVIIVVAAGGGIAGIFAVLSLFAAISLVWTFVIARRTLHSVTPARGDLDRRTRLLFLRFAGIQTLDTLLFLIVWNRAELFILDAYSTSAEIALYTVAFAISASLALIPQSLIAVLGPAFATLHGAGRSDRIRSGYGRAVRLMTLAAIPITAAGLALGPAAIDLVYGEDYSGAGPVLLVMLAGLPFVPCFSASIALLDGLGRAGAQLATSAIAAPVTIGLDLLLIPRYDAIGAAVGSTVGQLFGIVLVTGYTLRLTGRVSLNLGALARAALASGAAAAVSWTIYELLGGALGFVAALAVGIPLLVGLAAVLRVLPADDAAWLDEAAGARLGGAVGRFARLAAGRSAPAAAP